MDDEHLNAFNRFVILKESLISSDNLYQVIGCDNCFRLTFKHMYNMPACIAVLGKFVLMRALNITAATARTLQGNGRKSCCEFAIMSVMAGHNSDGTAVSTGTAWQSTRTCRAVRPQEVQRSGCG